MTATLLPPRCRWYQSRLPDFQTELDKIFQSFDTFVQKGDAGLIENLAMRLQSFEELRDAFFS